MDNLGSDLTFLVVVEQEASGGRVLWERLGAWRLGSHVGLTLVWCGLWGNRCAITDTRGPVLRMVHPGKCSRFRTTTGSG